jgi:hypothetical protein
VIAEGPSDDVIPDRAPETTATREEQASHLPAPADATAADEELAQRTEVEVSASGETEAEKAKEEKPATPQPGV